MPASRGEAAEIWYNVRTMGDERQDGGGGVGAKGVFAVAATFGLVAYFASLVGLAPVKAEVHKLASFIRIQRQAVRLSGVAPLTPQMLSELTLHDLGFAYDD